MTMKNSDKRKPCCYGCERSDVTTFFCPYCGNWHCDSVDCHTEDKCFQKNSYIPFGIDTNYEDGKLLLNISRLLAIQTKTLAKILYALEKGVTYD